MKLTAQQLADIRKRVEASTPGPWVVAQDTDKEYPNTEIYGPCARRRVDEELGDPIFTCGYAEPQDEANFAFLLAARTDVPALLAHVEALEKENQALRDAAEFWRHENQDLNQRLAARLYGPPPS